VVTQRKSTVAGKKRREILPKALRKRQLIQATMECIADVGLSQVTLSAVTKKAALSQGIANLHFDSKENLLMETLRFVTDEYNSGLQQIFDASGGE
jgi:TetR/AcrR family transcriptional repressor of bet genes